MPRFVPHHPSRRTLLLGAAATMLAGCSSGKDQPLVSAAHTVESIFDTESFTVQDVERTPYAAIGVRAGDQAEAMVVLASVAGPELHWIAADATLIVTRHGRIVRWQGPDGAVTQLTSGTHDPVVDGTLGRGGSAECLRLLDLPVSRRYGVVARSTLTEAAPTTVRLLYGNVPTRHFIEDGQSDTLDWSFHNDFYLDPASGETLKSVQAISPALPVVEIRVLRPYLGPAA